AGIALGVLVGQLAALGLHHPRAGVVLGRDQLDVVFLATVLVGDGLGEFGVVAFDAGVARKHGLSGWSAEWTNCSPRPCGSGHGRDPVPGQSRPWPLPPEPARLPRKRARQLARPSDPPSSQWCRIRSAMMPVAIATSR